MTTEAGTDSSPSRRQRSVPPPASSSIPGRLSRIEGVESLAVILSWKLAVFLVIVLAHALLPVRGAGGGLHPNNPPLATVFKYWDSSHYIYLAEHGYQAGRIDNAFAPLYPFVMSSLNLVTRSSVVSGLLISNLASAVGLYLFYVFVRRRHGAEKAMRALLLFLAFPTAFYLGVVYSEGLFLGLALLCFTALYRGAYAWAAVFAFLLALTRPQGIYVMAPMALVMFAEPWREMRRTGVLELDVARLGPRLLYLLAPVVALVLYFAYMRAVTGDAFSALHAQDAYISHRSLANVLRPWLVVSHLFISDLSLHSYTTSAIDRLFFVGFVVSLPFVYRRVDLPLFVFCLLMGLEPFLGSYMSYTRYVMLAFPLFIAAGVWLERASPYAFCAVLFPLLALQTLFIVMHSLNYWVA